MMQYDARADAAWRLLCQQCGLDPDTAEQTGTCSLRDAWQAMLAFAAARRALQTDIGVGNW